MTFLDQVVVGVALPAIDRLGATHPQCFAWRVAGAGDRVFTLVLDGENIWGSYRADARP